MSDIEITPSTFSMPRFGRAKTDGEVNMVRDDEFNRALSRVYAAELLLKEILRDLARQREDPKRYLASLSDRVVRRLDQHDPTTSPQTDTSLREAVEAIITRAGEGL
jgi:hypothetical protein